MGLSGPPAELFSSEYFQNPYPTLAWLRTHDPVAERPFPMGDVPVWIVTRYEDVRALVTDPRISNDYENASPEFRAAGLGFSPLGKNISMADPPDHTRLRKLTTSAFTPHNIKTWHSTIEGIVDDLLDSYEGRDTIDLVAEYASDVPARVTCAVLGMEADRGDFVRFHSAGVGSGDPERMKLAGQELPAYAAELIERKRGEPGDDLATELIAAHDEGDRLSGPELVMMITTLIIAGFDTTQHLIANSVLALFDHPEQRKLLVDDPKLPITAVDEFLRYEASIAFPGFHFAKEPFEFAGTRLPSGAPVLASVLSANHDPDQFVNPDALDLRRPRVRHMTFGHGLHHCLGAPLARSQGGLAIAALLARFPDLSLACPRDELRYRDSIFSRSLETLPVSLG